MPRNRGFVIRPVKTGIVTIRHLGKRMSRYSPSDEGEKQDCHYPPPETQYIRNVQPPLHRRLEEERRLKELQSTFKL